MNLPTALATLIHTLDHPFLIQFPPSWPIPGIRWYGFAYVLGFIAGIVLMRFYAKKKRLPLNTENQTELLTWLILGVVIGGRLGYLLLYDFHLFIQKPWIFFYFTQGGMASHGGFVGVALAIIFFAKSRKLRVLELADMVATLTPPGLFLGRIANFINGELYGKITTVPWGVVFKTSMPFANYPLEMVPARHPSQIYEAFFEGLVLLVYTQWLFWKKSATFRSFDPSIQKNLFPPGIIAARFLGAYALLRIFCELFREPDAALIFGLSRGTLYSILTLLFAICLEIWIRKKKI
jgi:phosphatidylglycerol---prolipoprotein diacylglyceryl transferase